jgi:thiamine pyrophosphokinase
MKAIILAGGDLALRPNIQELFHDAAFIVAADSGLHHAVTLNVKPNVIVGDFDSVDNKILQQFPDVPKENYSRHKDLLDLEIALAVVLGRGATSIHILGSLGSRLDQSLAALFIAARFKREGIAISLHGQQDIYFLLGLENLRLSLPVSQRFSLLSLDEVAVVSLQNAVYPLHEFALEFGVGLGVSNEVKASPLTVSVHEGLVVLVLEYGE